MIGDTECFSAELRLLGEQPAQVDAGADDSVVARPGAQHFARTGAEVEHSGPRFQAQRRAEHGELLGRERVMDAVSTFGDVEDPWDIQCRTSPCGCEELRSLPNAANELRAAWARSRTLSGVRCVLLLECT